VELKEPATQLALVIEAAPEDGVPAQIIRELAYKPLKEMIQLPILAKHLGPLLERHRKSIEILRERSEAKDGVIFFDVSDLDLEGYNKFIPYLLHRECVYSISVSASATRAKVSLGRIHGIRRRRIRIWRRWRRSWRRRAPASGGDLV